MPMYSTLCAGCGSRASLYRKIAERDDLPGCECGGTLSRVIDRPFIRPDITPYESPLHPGTMINSRAQRHEEMTRHGKLEWEPGMKKDILRRQESNIETACAVADKAIDETVRELTACGHLET